MIEVLESKLADLTVVEGGDESKGHGCYNGQCTFVMDNKCGYEGSVQNGMFHGNGTFSWPENVTYQGDFSLGKMNGKGVYKWPDGSCYTGTILDGKRHGNGVHNCSSGQSYEGQWKYGLRDGKGTLYYDNVKLSRYEGNWKAGLRDGHGVMNYASGNMYEGDWKGDAKCGNGAMSWRTVGETYVGSWRNNVPHGFGEHIWGTIEKQHEGAAEPHAHDFHANKSMCNIYRGEWKDGVRHGKGTFFYANGSQYSGYWENNKKHGRGIFVRADGLYSAVSFRKDLMDANSPKPPAQSEDVNPLFRMNIDDALDCTPYYCISKNRAADVGDIERMLLLHNATLRNLYRKYTHISSHLRHAWAKIPQGAVGATSTSTCSIVNTTMMQDWPLGKKVMENARSLHKRIQCMSVGQVTQCVRDAGLIGPYMSSHDVRSAIAEMKNQQSVVALKVQRQRKQKYQAHVQERARMLTEKVAISEKTSSLTSPRVERDRMTAKTQRGVSAVAQSTKPSAPSPVEKTPKGGDTMGTVVVGSVHPKNRPLRTVSAPMRKPSESSLLSMATVNATHIDDPDFEDPNTEDIELIHLFDDNKPHAYDNANPILEREFVEIIVRIILKHGITSGCCSISTLENLSDTITSQFCPIANGHHHIAVPETCHSFTQCFHHPTVQNWFREHHHLVVQMWINIPGAENFVDDNGEVAHGLPLQLVISYLLSLCGTVLPEDIDVVTLLSMIGKLSMLDQVGYDPIYNFSVLSTLVDVEDLKEFLSRLMMLAVFEHEKYPEGCWKVADGLEQHLWTGYFSVAPATHASSHGRNTTHSMHSLLHSAQSTPHKKQHRKQDPHSDPSELDAEHPFLSCPIEEKLVSRWIQLMCVCAGP